MKTVLLCGGQGTRLGEVTQGLRPKPMVEVAGRPILWHIMHCYYRFGYKDFVICTGYMGTHIREYFRNYQIHNSDFRISTSSGEIELLGGSYEDWDVVAADTGAKTMTAGRLARVKKYLDDDSPFFLTYGDGVSNVDIKALLSFHKERGKLATITGVVPPGRFGELHIEGDMVTAMQEKPDHTDRYINGGFMILEPEFIDRYCASDDVDDIMLERAPMENAARDGELNIYRHDGFWQCMDTMRDWQYLNDLAKDGRAPWTT